MAERIKDLGFQGQVVGKRVSSGFNSSNSGAANLPSVFQGIQAIGKRNEAQRLRAEREKEKALKRFVTTIENDYKTNLDVIELQSPRNPRAIVTNGEAYKKGILSGTPPELQEVIGAKIDNYINLKRAKANQAAIKEIQDENQANEERLEFKNFAIVSESSRGLYSKDLDLRNASEDQLESLESELAIRLHEEGIDDFGVPFALHTKDKITKGLQSFRDTSQTVAVKGWFREQENLAKAFGQLKRGGFKIELTTFEKNKDGILEESFEMVSVMGVLSPNARDKLFQDLASEMKRVNASAKKQEAIKLEENLKNQALTAFSNWRRIEEPEPFETPLTSEEIEDQLEAGLLKQVDAVAQLKAINELGATEDDPDFYNMIDELLDEGQDVGDIISEGFREGLLMDRSAAAFRTENRTQLDEATTSIQTSIANISKDARSDLSTGLRVNTLFKRFDKDEGPRIVKARQDMRRRIREIENESAIETVEDVEIFREKVNNLTNELIKTRRFKRRTTGTQIPAVVPAMTPEQITTKKLEEGYLALEKQRADGDISEGEQDAEAGEIMNLLMEEKNKKPESGEE